MRFNHTDPNTGSIIHPKFAMMLDGQVHDARSLQQHIKIRNLPESRIRAFTPDEEARYAVEHSGRRGGSTIEYDVDNGLGSIAPTYLQNMLNAQLAGINGEVSVTTASLLGLEGNDVPTITLFGKESVGKSLTLSRLLNRMIFPIGVGRCTLLPIQFHMKTGSPLIPRISVMEVATGKRVKRTFRQFAHAEPGVHKAEMEYDHVPITLLCQAIRERMDVLCSTDAADGRKFVNVDYEIVVEMQAPDLPNLIVVDLPGMVKVDEQHNQVTFTKELTLRYLKANVDNTLPFLVHTFGDDIKNSPAYEVAEEAGMLDKCTVIYTKLDQFKPAAIRFSRERTQIPCGELYLACGFDRDALGEDTSTFMDEMQAKEAALLRTFLAEVPTFQPLSAQQEAAMREKGQTEDAIELANAKREERKNAFACSFGISSVSQRMRDKFDDFLSTVYVPKVIERLRQNCATFEEAIACLGNKFVAFMPESNTSLDGEEDCVAMRRKVVEAAAEHLSFPLDIGAVPSGVTAEEVSRAAVAELMHVLSTIDVTSELNSHIYENLMLPIERGEELLCRQHLPPLPHTSDGGEGGKDSTQRSGVVAPSTALSLAVRECNTLRQSIIQLLEDALRGLSRPPQCENPSTESKEPCKTENASNKTAPADDDHDSDDDHDNDTEAYVRTLAETLTQRIEAKISESDSAFKLSRFSSLIETAVKCIRAGISEGIDASVVSATDAFLCETRARIKDIVSFRLHQGFGSVTYSLDPAKGGPTLAGTYCDHVLSGMPALDADYLLKCAENVSTATEVFAEDSATTEKRKFLFRQLLARHKLLLAVICREKAQ